MGRRPAIPKTVRRQVLMEAGYRCSIETCRHATVEVHHIEPWSERQSHDAAFLIALCPNCHDLADRGTIDRATLRHLKASLAGSQLHSVAKVIFDAAAPFDSIWGPSEFTVEEREQLILELKQRGMLSGILSGYEWPLVRCTMCEALVPVDRLWTPQDDSTFYATPLAAYCDFKCAREYQQAMKEFLERTEYPEVYVSEYILQNTVEMTVTGSNVFHRRRTQPEVSGAPVQLERVTEPPIVSGTRIL